MFKGILVCKIYVVKFWVFIILLKYVILIL